MHNLNYQLKLLCRHNADGSYATQANRLRMLQLAARQLKELGYRKMSAQSLKPKHVEALVQRWQEEGLTTETLDNRLSALRWWAERVGSGASWRVAMITMGSRGVSMSAMSPRAGRYQTMSIAEYPMSKSVLAKCSKRQSACDAK